MTIREILMTHVLMVICNANECEAQQTRSIHRTLHWCKLLIILLAIFPVIELICTGKPAFIHPCFW